MYYINKILHKNTNKYYIKIQIKYCFFLFSLLELQIYIIQNIISLYYSFFRNYIYSISILFLVIYFLSILPALFSRPCVSPHYLYDFFIISISFSLPLVYIISFIIIIVKYFIYSFPPFFPNLNLSLF